MGFGEFLAYLYSFFSGAITTVQLLFKPKYIKNTIRFILTGRWDE